MLQMGIKLAYGNGMIPIQLLKLYWTSQIPGGKQTWGLLKTSNKLECTRTSFIEILQIERIALIIKFALEIILIFSKTQYVLGFTIAQP